MLRKEERVTLTKALDEDGRRIAAWQAQAERQTQAIKKLAKAAELGNVRDLEKLRLAAQAAAEACAAQAAACRPLDFDSAAYLGRHGGYLDELRAQAAQDGVALYERDGVLFCYPVLVRLEPETLAVRVDKKLDFAIHPKVLAARLKKEQAKEPKTRPEQFLESLFLAYKLVRDGEYQSAPVAVPLKRVYDTLTLRPGSEKEYSVLDFTREVYLLDRSGVTQTRKGMRMTLTASTASRERQGDLLKFVTRDGHEKLYAGIKFTAPGKEQ